MKIIVEILEENKEVFEELKHTDTDSVEIVHVQRFVGDVEVITAVVTLTTLTIPILGKIIIELLKKNKYVKVKVDGIEISGLSEKNVMKILEKYSKKSE